MIAQSQIHIEMYLSIFHIYNMTHPENLTQKVYVRKITLIMVQRKEVGSVVYIYMEIDFQQCISNNSKVERITFCYVQAVALQRITGMLRGGGESSIG